MNELVRISARFGLLVLAALVIGIVALKWKPRPVTVDVVMVDDKFEPDRLNFKQDVRYRLRVENRGKDTHEFTAPTFFASAAIEQPGTLNREHSEIVVQPGDATDVVLTPLHRGTYDLRCSDHDWDGMVGGITVD